VHVPSDLLRQSLFGEAIENVEEIGAFLTHRESVIAVNRAIALLTGYSEGELMSGDMPSIAADEKTRRMRDEVEAGIRSDGRGSIRRKDGTVVDVSFVIARTQVVRDTLTLGMVWAAV